MPPFQITGTDEVLESFRVTPTLAGRLRDVDAVPFGTLMSVVEAMETIFEGKVGGSPIELVATMTLI